MKMSKENIISFQKINKVIYSKSVTVITDVGIATLSLEKPFRYQEKIYKISEIPTVTRFVLLILQDKEWLVIGDVASSMEECVAELIKIKQRK